MKAYYNKNSGYVVSFSSELALDYPFIDLSIDHEMLLNINAGKIAKIIDGQLVFEADRAEIISKIRSERKLLLAEADAERNKIYDNSAINSVEVDSEMIKAIAIYRQQLRDIVETVDIENIVWPQKPWLTV